MSISRGASGLKKTDTRIWVVLAALLLVVFSAGFYFGRRSLPYEISAGTQKAIKTEMNAAAAGAEKEPTAVSERAGSAEKSPKPAGKVNLNTADAEQLQTLPGIGEVLAGRILEYRKAYGKFTNIEQLMDVEGIGEMKFAAIRDQITVGE